MSVETWRRPWSVRAGVCSKCAPMRMSLEEVFLHVTTEDIASPDATPGAGPDATPDALTEVAHE